MKQKIFLILFASILLLSSCHTTNNLAYDFPVYITNTKRISLLPVSGIEKNVDILQHISGNFGKQHFSLQSYTIADDNGISLNLMNEMGTDLGFLSFQNNQLELNSAFFPKNIKLQYIIIDFQFCYYSPSVIAPVLKNSDLTFKVTTTVSADSETEIRTIYDNKKCIETIEKKKNYIKITNNLRKYEYILQDITE